jgi:hypothetical protein
MEQRLNSVEEELKVLKGQIKAVLLDIKEYMATAGNGQAYAPQPAPAGGSGGGAPAEGHGGSGPITVSNYGTPNPGMGGGYGGPGPAMGGGYGAPVAAGEGGQNVHEALPEDHPEEPVHATARRPRGGGSERDSRPRGEQRSKAVLRAAEEQLMEGTASNQDEEGVDASESGGKQVLDLLTVSVLAQWLARAMPAVGREQLGKLVEIYDITGNLAPRLKDTILLLADLCAGDSAEDSAVAPESVPAAVSVQLLIELDSLLRYRSGAVESVVLSLLLDKGQGTRKDSHG